MRNFHRWISTVGMVLLAWVALTGTILTIDELMDQQSFAESTMPGAAETLTANNSVALPRDQIATLLGNALHAALANNVNSATTAVRMQLQMVDGQPKVAVILDEKTAVADAGMGPGGPEGPGGGGRGPPSFNGLLQSLHGGSYVGAVGEWFILATGAFFVILSISGIWMYFQMRNARLKAKRDEWFWG
jgi:uncharacterized iron-regulated membrane protein